MLVNNNWEQVWKNADAYNANRTTHHFWQCFTHPGSLTHYLRDITDDTIQFRLKYAEWSHAHLEECEKLNVRPQELMWVREIDFYREDEMWVAARMVIPQSSLIGEAKILQEIGDRPMGEILFREPDAVSRSAFEICELPNNHWYYRNLVGERFEKPQTVWARRSILYFHHQPLLVIELFFPALEEILTCAVKAQVGS